MTTNKPNLNAAYSLETPEDNVELYSQWSQTYDQDFAKQMDYQLPLRVAELFLAREIQCQSVLDVGAGTGLLAESLNGKFKGAIDALDISPEMLEVAKDKGLYRETILGDLTKTLSIADASYDAIVSSGTFTHGHVGPDGLDELLRVARSGALFVLSINAEHYEAAGFKKKFMGLDDVIRGFEICPVKIYGSSADEAHADDIGHIAVFKKC